MPQLKDPRAYIKARFARSPALPDMLQDVELALAQGRTPNAAAQYARRNYARRYAPTPEPPALPDQADPAPDPREQASRRETGEILGLAFALAAQRASRRRPELFR